MTRTLEPQKIRVTAQVVFIVTTNHPNEIEDALKTTGDLMGYYIEGEHEHWVHQHYVTDVINQEPVERKDGLPF